jgi:4'-phosphopantetheinyl transferase
MNWQIVNPIKDRLILEKDEAHLWYFDLDNAKKEHDLIKSLLSQDELNRAASFHFEKDRKRYICARGILRLLISVYTGINPAKIKFCYSEFGKPELEKEIYENTIQFNLAHSENAAVFGFIKNTHLGIDIEFLRPIANFLEIAKRYFSTKESRQLNYFSEEKRTEAFYNCWVKKEAVIKAIGEGLSFPLKDFTVSLDMNEETIDLKSESNVELNNRKIFLSGFKPENNLTGAVALTGPVNKISYLKFDDKLSFSSLLDVT